MRQHVLGPYPFDPNLVSQGVPLDSRAIPDELTFAPIEGTPLPPGAVPAGTPPVPPLPGSLSRPPSLPSPPPPVATATYDPRTGRYIGSDGQVYEQSDLQQSSDPTTWTDLLPH
jgi:hypothetical protein